MNIKRIGWLLASILVFTLALSACTRSLSTAPDDAGQAPQATPTVVGAVPTAVTADAMAELMSFGTQTAMAAENNGAGDMTTPTEPPTETVDITPVVATTEAPATEPPTAAPTAVPTDAPPTATPTPAPAIVVNGNIPASYTLHAGEFPYCIARRYNINPDQLLQENGLRPSDGQIFYPGLTLTLPQNAGPFPSDRALRFHPDIYTVQKADETIYSIACLYGDVDPIDIANYNGLTAPYQLVIGQTLDIP